MKGGCQPVLLPRLDLEPSSRQVGDKELFSRPDDYT